MSDVPTAIAPELKPGGSAKLNIIEQRVRQTLADARLATAAKSRDLGALQQGKGPVMSEPSNDGGESGDQSNGNKHRPGGAGISDTIFTQPASQGAGKNSLRCSARSSG
jgi:hypothetical protein